LKLVDDGKEAPQQLYQQPELTDVESYYLDVFYILSSERSIGMSLGPIPYSAIRSYADEHDIVNRDEFDYFFGILRVLDAEYISLANSSDKNKADMIPISEVDEQHRMFARLKARAKKK
jgi:hypothetical protein